jgi:capsular exopolysaccharide synthesis family protein
VGTALTRDRMSDRIRGRADFERVSGVTVLATVPRMRWRWRRSPLPVTLRAPQSPAAESYRYLRGRLQPLLSDGDTTILVTSAAEGEGRTTTAANLAVAMALAGRSVILVDADLRRPCLHTVFGVDNGPGLVDLLAGTAAPDDVLRPSPLPQLRLVTAGPGAGFGADLLEGPRLARTLRALQKQCDVVVLDSAPLLSLADGISLAGMSDHVLLVGNYRLTTRGYVSRALAELGEVVDGNISGVLLNVPKSAGGLTPRGRAQATAIPVETGDTVVLAAAKRPQPETDRNGTAFTQAVVPAATTTASTVHGPSAAAAVTPRNNLERHN